MSKEAHFQSAICSDPRDAGDWLRIRGVKSARAEHEPCLYLYLLAFAASAATRRTDVEGQIGHTSGIRSHCNEKVRKSIATAKKATFVVAEATGETSA